MEVIPEVHVLKTVDWQLFGTLTFKRERMSERVRQAMTFALMRKIAKWNGVHFLSLPWVVRSERGEIGGRLHRHFLVSSLREPYGVSERSRFAIKNQWEKLGGGFARVRRYGMDYDDMPKPGDDSAYILKALGSTLDLNGADAFESGRFVESDLGRELIIAKSVWRIAASSKRRSEQALLRRGNAS